MKGSIYINYKIWQGDVFIKLPMVETRLASGPCEGQKEQAFRRADLGFWSKFSESGQHQIKWTQQQIVFAVCHHSQASCHNRNEYCDQVTWKTNTYLSSRVSYLCRKPSFSNGSPSFSEIGPTSSSVWLLAGLPAGCGTCSDPHLTSGADE